MNTETNPAGTMARLQAAEAELQRLREQEPVAWQWEDDSGICGSPITRYSDAPPGRITDATALYAAPVPPPDVRELTGLLEQAEHLARVASDWNLDEVEIDGRMVRTRELEETFRAALAKFRGQS